MKLFSTLFLPAIAFSSTSASASPIGAGRRIGAARTIDAGTTCSISARRDAAPITDSMCASAAASMPMWRAANSPAVSSSASGFRADISIVDSR